MTGGLLLSGGRPASRGGPEGWAVAVPCGAGASPPAVPAAGPALSIAGVPSLSRRRVSGARCVRGVVFVEAVEASALRLGQAQSCLDGARGRLYKGVKVPQMHRAWRLRVRLLFRSGRLRLAFRCVELRPSEWRPAEVNRGHRLVPSPDVFCLLEREGRTCSESYEFGGAMHRPTRRCSRRSRGLRSRDRS